MKTRRIVSLLLCVAMIFGVCMIPSIAATLRGDVNGDGEVNNLDVTRLMRMLAGLENEDADPDDSGDGAGEKNPFEELEIAARELSAGVSAGSVEASALDGRFSAAMTDFSLDLLKNTAALTEDKDKDKGVLVSPLSVALALSMTANGARDETLAQMEQLFGDFTVDELNAYFLTYSGKIAASKELKSANSIWFRDDDSFTVNDAFLQKNADYYGAQIYASAFDDSTVTDINNWVKKHTYGMIDSIIEEIDPAVVMYLMNALAFDAKWEKVFDRNLIYKDTFYAYNGQPREAALMNGWERYISGDDCRGFIKDYKGGRYSFAAFLPENSKVDIYDFVASLDADKLSGLLDSKASKDEVEIFFPQFTSDFDVSLADALAAMGMERAFDATGELDGIGASAFGELYIADVLHKTFIEVTPDGTKAAATTSVMVGDTSAPSISPITFDRPFVYAIIDNETNIPVFIGVLADVVE